MHITELLILSAGLAADACAVSMTNGMCDRSIRTGRAVLTAGSFGVMQGLMPLAGYQLGAVFYRCIAAYDHILALLLLGGIGGRMILDTLQSPPETAVSALSFRMILLQSIAVSIDALAVGISFSALPDMRILPAVLMIAGVTAALSFLGIFIGKRFGTVLSKKARICGGLLLILIGVRIFISHITGNA